MDSSSVSEPPSSSSTMVSSRSSACSKLGLSPGSAGGGLLRGPMGSFRPDRFHARVGLVARELQRQPLADAQHAGGANETTVRAPGDAKTTLEDERGRQRAQPVGVTREPAAALLVGAPRRLGEP